MEAPHPWDSNKKYLHGNSYSDDLKDLVLKLMTKD